MRSIRRFLVIVLIAAITLINFLAALHGYNASLAAADALFDEELKQLAAVLATSVVLDNGGAGRTISNPDPSLAYQVWNGSDLLLRSDNAPVNLIAPLEPGFHDLNFSQYRWRATVVRDLPFEGNWIIVAERSDRRFVLAEKVIIESIIPIVACLPLIGLLVWLIVSRGLSPLRELATQLQGRHPNDLSPIKSATETTELRQLANSINDLLQRLADAFEREKRFAANAAHELRTPLSVLKVQLYNLQQELSDGESATQSLRRGLDRLSHLVEQVLALHVAGQERNNLQHKSFDLAAMCRQVIGDYYSVFEIKSQTVGLDAPKSLIIDANTESMHSLVTNLLSNASKYTPNGGEILLSLSTDTTMCTLNVEDSGPGIPPAEREQVFERFYRSGEDRFESSEPGCGLGLAIVKQIVDSHRGSIQLDQSAKLGGLRVCVSVPRAWIGELKT